MIYAAIAGAHPSLRGSARLDSAWLCVQALLRRDRMTIKSAPRILVEGQRLDQPTFHSLYEAMPPGTRAELIDGVVHMPSPVGRSHGSAQVPVLMWLGAYAANTPGVEVLDNATTILGWKSEPQPDALLRVLPECGGRSHHEQDFVHGAPELVVEVAKATRYVDLGPKLRDYEGAGVLEYVIRAFDPDEIYWYTQDQGELVQRPIGDDGLYHSIVFPGLWLDPIALLSGDTRRLLAVFDLGCATPEHGAFVARLTAGRDSS
jgi:Uma2 family endonuclease